MSSETSDPNASMSNTSVGASVSAGGGVGTIGDSEHTVESVEVVDTDQNGGVGVVEVSESGVADSAPQMGFNGYEPKRVGRCPT